MKVINIFFVMAYRYGNIENYNFPVGCFMTFNKAKASAEEHHLFRGYKYNHRIWKLTIDQDYDANEAELVFDSCN